MYEKEFEKAKDADDFVLNLKYNHGVKIVSAVRAWFKLKAAAKKSPEKTTKEKFDFLSHLKKMQLLDMIKYKAKINKESLLAQGFDVENVEKILEVLNERSGMARTN